ncbi:MAG TPA: enoyl-CoA hydratase/isomerase family protein [Pseudomonadales bacterium]|nr:enoyl-CoA hydratase/isomerase family protein [Pseudomonadales bacterium]
MTDTILLEEIPLSHGKSLGLVTLNNERTLNALTLEMIHSLYAALQRWQADSAVVAVFLQGAGDKAFCAGGNVRSIYDSVKAHPQQIPNQLALDFFASEYRLDYLIHCYKKPLIVWGHGIVMGGGIGLMAGASHRVVTEKSRLAMPEISIGLFPDVGATWFLNRAPQNSGLFLGLTGAQLNAADALFVGLADAALPHAQRDFVLDQLKMAQWSDDAFLNSELVNRILRNAGRGMELPTSNVRKFFDLINESTQADSLPNIVEKLLQTACDDPWWQTAIQKLKIGCPTTAHLVYQQLQRGKKLSLVEVFQRELIMALQCVARADFVEGVRALLVDKDQRPQWQFADVGAVPVAWVEQHFMPPWSNQTHPLADL